MNEDMSNIPERRSGLIWDKSISLGNVLTMVGMVVCMFVWGGKLEGRVSILESADVLRKEANASQRAIEDRRDAETRQDFREIRNMIEALRNSVVKKN